MSVYTPNIPQAGDVPAQSQPLILANFQALQDDLNKNHVAISDLANRGKHTFCQFPVQVAAPATAALEGAIYTKDIGAGDTELYYRNESNGTEYRLTNGLIPRIATTLWNSTAGFTQVIALPNNCYGNIYFLDLANTLGQMGYFYTVGNRVRGFACRTDYQFNAGGSDHIITLNNDPAADSNLYAKYSLPAVSQTYNVRVIYWNQTVV